MLKGKPDLRKCLTRCGQCGIFFLCHPRNAGRGDLRCPFGCAEAHRKEGSHNRSAEYYRSECGRVKKRIQNEKRRERAKAPWDDGEKLNCGNCSPPMLTYLAMVLTLIEERRVRREEVAELLSRKVRQHSIVRRSKIEHSIARLRGASP